MAHPKTVLDVWSNNKRPSCTLTSPNWGWFRWKGRQTTDDLDPTLWDALVGETGLPADRWKVYPTREEALEALKAALEELGR
jgi:hypothetical protein